VIVAIEEAALLVKDAIARRMAAGYRDGSRLRAPGMGSAPVETVVKCRTLSSIVEKCRKPS
jgi:hypothetical protein